MIHPNLWLILLYFTLLFSFARWVWVRVGSSGGGVGGSGGGGGSSGVSNNGGGGVSSSSLVASFCSNQLRTFMGGSVTPRASTTQLKSEPVELK
ncbi:hypothetical protein PIB30_087183, partial [Stylosanthes scabra]|nr:hypothetical protein [Stylosanthes scabra]